MKVLCVIDHFGSGGAQRQMVNLAQGLKAKGHQVEMFIYYAEHDFFRSIIDQAGIPVHEVRKRRGFSLGVLWRLTRLLRRERYDSVVSFLSSPNVYAELACVFVASTRLIVSERNSEQNDKNNFTAVALRIVHGLADWVTTNSYRHADWLMRYPWLRQKVRTIYNGYHITPASQCLTDQIPPLRFLVVGRICIQKNPLSLLHALALFHEKHGFVPQVSWAGVRESDPVNARYCQELDDFLQAHSALAASWEWLGQRNDIVDLLAQHRALIHPAIYEGLPNAVCEALMSARPVLASAVGDHPMLVEDTQRGFLFDPHSPQAIANALEKLVSLDAEGWQRLSRNARQYAVENLSIERMVSSYEAILSGCFHE